MAKYTSDKELIRGAGRAYKDWSNVPGMYSGLDKISEASKEMTGKAISSAEEDIERLEKKAEEDKAKSEAVNKAWNATADKILLNAAALGDTIYKSTVEDVKKLKEIYIQSVDEKDDTKRMEALKGLQAHSLFIQDHKKTNLNYAHLKLGVGADGKSNTGLSNYFKKNNSTKSVIPGIVGGVEEANIIEQISGGKYTKTSKAEDGDYTFHVKDLAGKEVLVTSEQYNNLVLPRNFSITANTEKLKKATNANKQFDINTVTQSVENSIPRNEREFVASLYDDVSGKTLSTMLTDSKTLDMEIKYAVDKKAWDDDKDGILDEGEKAKFIDAATNPANKFFDWNISRQILVDQVVNGVEQSHAKQWEATSKPLTISEQIKLKEFNLKQQEKQQTKIDNQNTVYSIEKEFSDGETTIGPGSRYAQKDKDGLHWNLYEDEVLIKQIGIGESVLDEITKHVTDTAGKYGTFQIGVSEKEITKDGVTTKYVYTGNGKWSPKK